MNQINTWIYLKSTPQNNNISILCTCNTFKNGELGGAKFDSCHLFIHKTQLIKKYRYTIFNILILLISRCRPFTRKKIYVQGNGWWIYFSQNLQGRESWVGSYDRGHTNVYHRVNMHSFILWSIRRVRLLLCLLVFL